MAQLANFSRTSPCDLGKSFYQCLGGTDFTVNFFGIIGLLSPDPFATDSAGKRLATENLGVIGIDAGQFIVIARSSHRVPRD